MQRGINSGEECRSLLTDIRKYLEHHYIQGYWNLRMCANWTLHATLDNTKNKTVKDFLEEMNNFLKDGNREIERYPGLKYKLMFLTSLRDELSSLLRSIGINTSICEDPHKIRSLLRSFGEAVEDTPLICKANSQDYIFDEISYSQRASIFDRDMWPKTMYWTIRKDGRVLLRIDASLVIIPYDIGDVYIEMLTFVTNRSFE